MEAGSHLHRMRSVWQTRCRRAQVLRIGRAAGPKIAGERIWRDDRTLAFTPAADWPLGKKYTVEFKRRGFVWLPLRDSTH
jgi:hypothetical protein